MFVNCWSGKMWIVYFYFKMNTWPVGGHRTFLTKMDAEAFMDEVENRGGVVEHCYYARP